MKSVLVDFLVGAGLKPVSIVSYNHLGNNDGMNLSAPQTFRWAPAPLVSRCWPCLSNAWPLFQGCMSPTQLPLACCTCRVAMACTAALGELPYGEQLPTNLPMASQSMFNSPPLSPRSSKEISKSNVVDDMVASNPLLYDDGEHPDHCVVIK